MADNTEQSGATSEPSASTDGADPEGSKSAEKKSAKAAPDADEAAKPEAADGDAIGSSLASVVAGMRLSDAAAAIATVVSGKAEIETVILVEDRNVAVSDVIFTDVGNTLTALAGLLGRIETLLGPTTRRRARRESVGEGEAKIAADEEEPEEEELPTPLESLKQLGEIVGLFRSTFELTPQQIKVDRTALMASVAGAITGKTVVLPTMAWVRDAPVLSTFRDLLVRRHATGIAVGRLEAELESRVTKLTSLRTRRTSLEKKRDDAVIGDKPSEADRFERLIDETDREIARIANDGSFQRRRAILQATQAMLLAFDERHAALAKAPESGASPLIQAALREQIRQNAGDEKTGNKTAVLWVETASTGGDRLTRSSPLGWNNEVSFLGAAQAIYLLVATNGKLLAAGSETSFGHKSFDFHEFFDATTGSRDRRWRQELSEYLTIGSALVVGLVALAAILLVFNAVFS